MELSTVFSLNLLTGQSVWGDALIIFFAKYLPYLLVLLFALFAFRRAGSLGQRAWLFAEGIVAAVASRALVEVMRVFIHRARPFAENALTPLLNETSYSFPSGHASFFFALSTVVFFYDRRVGKWLLLASFIIGFARIAAGVHYPTDILGGAVLGILVGWLIHTLATRLARKSVV